MSGKNDNLVSYARLFTFIRANPALHRIFRCDIIIQIASISRILIALQMQSDYPGIDPKMRIHALHKADRIFK